MRLYTTTRVPNPRIVDMILLEKSIDILVHVIDILSGENRNAEFLAKNPMGLLPALETDDGFVMSEVTAIAEYLEELHPDPVLVGSNATERAQTRMWARRLDIYIMTPMQLGFQNGVGKKFFEGRVKLYPSISESMIEKASDGLVWLDEQLAGKQFLCGDRLTYGDFMIYAYLDYFRKLGQQVEPGLVHLTEHFDNMSERESVKATSGR